MLLRNGVLSVTSAIVSAATSLLAFRLLIGESGPSELGAYSLASASLFLLRFADLNANSAALRIVAGAKPSSSELNRFFVQVSALNIAAFCLAAIVSLMVSPILLPHLIPGTELAATSSLVICLVITACVQLLSNQVSAFCQGIGKFGGTCLTSVIGSIGVAGGAWHLVVDYQALGLALSILIGAIIQLALNGVLLIHGSLELKRFGIVGGGRLSMRDFISLAFRLNSSGLLAALIDPLTKMALGSSQNLVLVGIFEAVTKVFGQMRAVLLAPAQPIIIAMISEPEKAIIRHRQIFAYGSLVALLSILAYKPLGMLVLHFFKIEDDLFQVVYLSSLVIFVMGLFSVASYAACSARGIVTPQIVSTSIVLGSLPLVTLGAHQSPGIALLVLGAAHILAALGLTYTTTAKTGLPFVPDVGRGIQEVFATIMNKRRV